jgi:hypothetical protein
VGTALLLLSGFLAGAAFRGWRLVNEQEHFDKEFWDLVRLINALAAGASMVLLGVYALIR